MSIDYEILDIAVLLALVVGCRGTVTNDVPGPGP